jgi:hypothetical protein
VTLVSDGCATVTAERQEFTLGSLKDRYVRVVDTSAILEEIGSRLRRANADG